MESDKKCNKGRTEFIENIIVSRFNFLLIFYALTVAGSLQTRDYYMFNIVLTIGAFVCTLIAITAARAQFKLDLAQGFDTEAPKEDLEEARVPFFAKIFAKNSRRHLIGYYIPLVCYGTLWTLALLGWFGFINPYDC